MKSRIKQSLKIIIYISILLEVLGYFWFLLVMFLSKNKEIKQWIILLGYLLFGIFFFLGKYYYFKKIKIGFILFSYTFLIIALFLMGINNIAVFLYSMLISLFYFFYNKKITIFNSN